MGASKDQLQRFNSIIERLGYVQRRIDPTMQGCSDLMCLAIDELKSLHAELSEREMDWYEAKGYTHLSPDYNPKST